MGMQQLMCTPLVSGGQMVVLARFDPELVARAIEHYRCTYWTAATTMFIALMLITYIPEISMWLPTMWME